MVGPLSSEHDAALPDGGACRNRKEELVTPVGAEADNVPLVNHERNVRVFDGRRHCCKVLPHVLDGVYIATRKAVELLLVAVAESSHGHLGSNGDRHLFVFFFKLF